MRARLARWRQDPAIRLGLMGGTIVSAAGLVGYTLVPVMTGRSPTPIRAVFDSAILFLDTPAAFHVAVLFVPALLVSLLVFYQARKAEVRGWRSDLKVLGGILLMPIAVVWITMVLFALLLAFAGLIFPEAYESPPLLYPGRVLLFLFFGSFPALAMTIGIFLTVGPGIGGGYVVVRAAEWLSQRSGSGNEQGP